jgi:hypothetical protein
MRYLVLAIGLLACVSSSFARTSNTEQMLKLSPETRLEQRCNARAMEAIGREHKGFKPDELVAYAFADPAIKGNTIKAPGAAVRSRGKWFRLSYSCEASGDALSVVTFQYSLGTEVPRAEWAEHFLVP